MKREYAVVVRDSTMELVKLTELENQNGHVTLEYIQAVVGGYIEIVDAVNLAGPIQLHVYGNEEGKMIGLPLNVLRRDGEPLVGPLVLLAGDMVSGDTLPLTAEEAGLVQLVTHLAGDVPVLVLNAK